MIGRAVTFDSEHVIRAVRQFQTEIDPESGTADLRIHAIALRPQKVAYLKFKLGIELFELVDGNRSLQRNIAVFRIIQILSKQSCALRASTFQVDIRVMHGGNQLNVVFRTSDRNIQSPFTTRPIQWAEVMNQPSLRIPAIGNAEDDGVALITLHRFKVLDEERFLSIVPEEKFLFRSVLPLFGKQPVNQILLFSAERDHAKTAVRIFLDMPINQIDNTFRFLSVGLGLIHTVHMVIIHANSGSVGLGRRERHKIAVIEILVGEGDELFGTASVMPTQLKRLHTGRTYIQNGFEVLHIAGFLITVFHVNGGIEEIARRHLLGVAYNNELIRPIDCANRILWEDLRSLIEHNNIEMNGLVRTIGIPCQEGTDAQRRHQEARLDSLDKLAYSLFSE